MDTKKLLKKKVPTLVLTALLIIFGLLSSMLNV